MHADNIIIKSVVRIPAAELVGKTLSNLHIAPAKYVKLILMPFKMDAHLQLESVGNSRWQSLSELSMTDLLAMN